MNNINRHLSVEVKLEVGRGNVCFNLLDDRGQPKVSVRSTPGKPALVRGSLVTDASSVIKDRITTTEVENIEYSLTVHQ